MTRLLLFSFSFIIEKYPTITASDEIANFALKEDTSAAAERFGTIAQLLLDIFTINSYAASSEIRPLPSTSSSSSSTEKFPAKLFEVALRAPANLWSSQVLAVRGDQPQNYFEVKVLEALARRVGLRFQCLSSRVSNQIDLSHVIKISE